MYRTLGITAFSFLVVTLFFSANADDSPQVDTGKDAPPEISEKLQERIRQFQTLRHGADQRDPKIAPIQADREQERLARKSEYDLLQRLQSNSKELGEDELREAVRILAGRLLRLEDEVRLLRQAPPRIELLR